MVVAEQRLAPMARKVGKCMVGCLVEIERWLRTTWSCSCWFLVTESCNERSDLKGYLYPTCSSFSEL